MKQAFPRVHRTSNQRDSIISNTKQRKFKRPLLKEIALTKLARCFPAVPSTVTSFDYVHLDKLLEYALTEVTHRFCGKRRALSNFLKAISFYYLNR